VTPARLIAQSRLGQLPPRSGIVTGEVPRQLAGPHLAAGGSGGDGARGQAKAGGDRPLSALGARMAGKRGGREITKL